MIVPQSFMKYGSMDLDLLYDFMRGDEYAWANAIRPYGGMRGGFPTLKELFVFLSI